MVRITELLADLSEKSLAQRVTLQHDQARVTFPLRNNIVRGFDEFKEVTGAYVAHHSARCIGRGGTMSPADAQGLAEELVDREYRRKGGDFMEAYQDALDGTSGGLRVILDMLCESLKYQAVERYVRSVFDRHIARASWGEKVEAIRQFIERCGAGLSSSIDAEHPERYAQNYMELVREYVNSMQRTSALFRRL